MLTKEEYAKVKTWKEKYPDNKVKFDTLEYDESWDKLFEKLKEEEYKNIEEGLSKEMENNKNIIMHPQPDYVFNAFKFTPFKGLKVVIVCQDSYPGTEMYGEHKVSQAMGIALSVPVGFMIPSSLKNVYANLMKYKHIQKMPKHCNLESWANQGVLLMNAALTVKDGMDNRNCHSALWASFTDKIISYISQKKKNVIFVLWGAFAYGKADLINTTRHAIIASSHPSGLSANKPMREFPAFADNDHFGQINAQLEEWGKDVIDWNV